MRRFQLQSLQKAARARTLRQQGESKNIVAQVPKKGEVFVLVTSI